MTTLYDAFGRKIEYGKLEEELAAPAISSIRSTWFDSVANTLDPERLGEILYKVDQGDICEYLTLAEEMEERDLHYHSVLGTRKLGVSSLDILVEAPTDNPKDIEIKDAVKECVDDDAFDNLVNYSLDALGKGFSVSEIIWKRDTHRWTPKEYKWRDQRYFTFDIDTKMEVRLLDESGPVNGIELVPYKFIVHKPLIKTGLIIRRGLARLAAVAYMCKSYTLKDWLSFIEVFGMPIRVGRFPTGATRAQRSALLNAVTNIGANAAAIIPEKMMIEFINGSGSGSGAGDKVFKGMAEYLDSQISKGILGQTMTSDNGSSLAQATIHNEVRKDIRNADAKQLAATLRRDFVKPFVDLNFGPQEKYPHLRIDVSEPEDLVSLSKALPPFIKLGLRIEESEIRDKFKLSEPADDASLLGALKTDKQLEAETHQKSKDAGSSQSYQQARRDALIEILGAAGRGDVLTDDQRALLQAVNDSDTIDAMVDNALDDWESIVDPMMKPIFALAEASEDFGEFIEGLDKAMETMDGEAALRSFAINMFMSRGLGSAKDDISND